MSDVRETVLEIDLDSLEHNYHYLRSKLTPSTLFMGVVKASGYGSDAVVIAQKLEALGIDYLAVAYVREGILLRKAGVKVPILVLHPQAVNFEMLIENCLEPSIYSTRILKEFIAASQRAKQKDYPLHLKFNTGLNRLGFRENEIATILTLVKDVPGIRVKGLFSHLAASEDHKEEAFTRKQIASFKSIVGQVEEQLGYPCIKHLLNTSGILNYPENQWDMARSGIGLYGYGNDKAFDPFLKPVASLKTIISQLHDIEPNESVGYNRAFLSSERRTTATLPIGHADGIGRQYGNGRASVLVNGNKAAIIGNVCMDMLMIDVTGIDCKEGDEVLVFGKSHTAADFAAGANTISYELLTGIAPRVKRIYKTS